MPLTSRDAAGRQLLSPEQLCALDTALLYAYSQHRELCRAHPVAKSRIARPSLPSSFSESLAALVLPSLIDEVVAVSFGGRQADLVALTPDKRLLVEVKASGASSFQELKERDLAADALMWIDFARRYVDGAGSIVAHFLPDPSRYVPPRRKLTLNVFLAAASQFSGFRSLRFESVVEVLQRNGSDRRSPVQRLPFIRGLDEQPSTSTGR